MDQTIPPGTPEGEAAEGAVGVEDRQHTDLISNIRGSSRVIQASKAAAMADRVLDGTGAAGGSNADHGIPG